MLVAVLTALSGSGKPDDLQVCVVKNCGRRLRWVNDCNGHCTRVYPPASFGRRHALNAVPTCLDAERSASVSFDFNIDLGKAVARRSL